jgi:phosphoglucomutase
MDAESLSICGEESFGTGGDHIREKDGMWAALAWLSICAYRSAHGMSPSIADAVREMWKDCGRSFYVRYDYEEVEKRAADVVWHRLRFLLAEFPEGGAWKEVAPPTGMDKVSSCDEFSFVDPIDGSKSSQQGIRFLFPDGSRVIFRQSGTGSVGTTIRVYFERVVYGEAIDGDPAEAIHPLEEFALRVSDLARITGRSRPTVIT